MNKTSGETEVSDEVIICNEKGLHARASAMFVKCCQRFDARVSVTRQNETVSGSSIMDLLMLVAGKGTRITITASGPQAKEALAALRQLVDNGFFEND